MPNYYIEKLFMGPTLKYFLGFCHPLMAGQMLHVGSGTGFGLGLYRIIEFAK